MMKNYKYIFLTLALSFVYTVSAQQDPNFSMYKYNMSVINPAFAGASEGLQATIGYRSQWSGIDGAVETQNYNVNSPVSDKVGLGISLIQDRIFVLAETHLYADFSYKLQVADDTNLFLGIKAGGSFLNINLNQLGVENDPLFSENIDTFNPNVGVGAYLKGNKYYVTLSAPGLLQSDRYEKEGITPVEGVDNVHFFAGAGYQFDLSDSFSLNPAVLAKAVAGAPLSVDLNASLMYNDRFEIGANYRLDESYTGFFTVGFADYLRFGYAYERSTTTIQDFSDGTHEFIFQIQLD